MPKKTIPTAQERRQQNRDEIIDDILAIAREMMQADGVAALRFNNIARRLGMKPPSLYTYFDSKHAIYDMLFKRGFEAFSQHMDTETKQTEGIEAYLHSGLSAYMGFALENPDLFQLMFQRPVPGFVPSEESMAVSLAALQKGREDLQLILEQSEINLTASIEETSDLIIALMHGLTELQLANNPELPVGEGRFGHLVESGIQLLLSAWSK